MTESSTASGTLMRWLSGSVATRVMGVVSRMNLADAIGDGVDLDDLAAAYEIPPERMIRLLRALVDLDLCVPSGQDRFALTELGSLLRKESPGSMADLVRLYTDQATHEVWMNLEAGLRSSRAAFDEVFGMRFFEYLRKEPELSEVYNAAMGQLTRGVAAALPEHYDFGGAGTVTDIGGGDGTLLAAVLERHPGLSGTVFDRAEVAAQAADTLRAAGVLDRCTIATGDFFQAVPAGAELYLIKSILHDWDDDSAATILRRCREAMSARSRLLIIEQVLPEIGNPGAPGDPDLADLTMLVIYGGKERTRAEFDQLCLRAGLIVTDVVPLTGQRGVCVIETAPA
ncbi:methyltransferase [Amycolatopsis nigrescens]|uniref:methyltransferase n=1 Tax=Amycolatopsis nigrescens TaxID=381445 RepID=UPI000382ECA5|nr:methyltransferase [Amycolatopsis nigrescens]